VGVGGGGGGWGGEGGGGGGGGGEEEEGHIFAELGCLANMEGGLVYVDSDVQTIDVLLETSQSSVILTK
jgi:hypothetical protein